MNRKIVQCTCGKKIGVTDKPTECPFCSKALDLKRTQTAKPPRARREPELDLLRVE